MRGHNALAEFQISQAQKIADRPPDNYIVLLGSEKFNSRRLLRTLGDGEPRLINIYPRLHAFVGVQFTPGVNSRPDSLLNLLVFSFRDGPEALSLFSTDTGQR